MQLTAIPDNKLLVSRIDRQTDKETDRQTNKQTDKQKDRQTDRQTVFMGIAEGKFAA